jgi:SPX domain protein involved in polyphosphate accumulation
MDPINDILNSFDRVTLEDLNAVRLLDRMDTKYIFNGTKLPKVLEDLRNDYKILAIDDKMQSCYQTIYYDTEKFTMYHQHHAGKANRFKVRLRRYCDSDINYFEIKLKNNRGRTIKSRFRKKIFSTAFDEKSSAFLQQTPFLPDALRPVLWVNYTRMTFAARDFSARLTIDTGLTFTVGDQNKSFDSLVIAEIKQGKATSSGFNVLMHRHKIPPLSISKYCLGISNLYPEVKRNNFKQKLLTIHKVITHGN